MDFQNTKLIISDSDSARGLLYSCSYSGAKLNPRLSQSQSQKNYKQKHVLMTEHWLLKEIVATDLSA